MMTEFRIATRRSPLAMAQARHVAGLLKKKHPGSEVTFVEIDSTGDLDRSSPVATLTEIGAFVRSVQAAVLAGRADLAVHSCKDLPVAGPPDLVPIFPSRASRWDALCGHDLDSLPPGAKVGTGSPRRASQMLRLRPDVQVTDIRGNVDTRLAKLGRDRYDAIILAEAGLERLGRTEAIGHRFTLEEMVPAPAQGALAVEARAGTTVADQLLALDDERVRTEVEAERAVLGLTNAGCRSALGASGRAEGALLRLSGFVEDKDGPRSATVEGQSADDAAVRLKEALAL